MKSMVISMAVLVASCSALGVESEAIQKVRNDLAAAASGDTVLVPDGVHELESELTVPEGVTLQGNGWESCILVQKTANKMAVKLTGSSTADAGAKLVGVTVTGCRDTTKLQGAITAGGNVRVSWCCVSNNINSAASGTAGGGLFINSGTVDHSIFAFNEAYSGGAIGRYNGTYGAGGTVTIDTCLFYGNKAKNNAGAIGGASPGCWTSLTLKNCTITDNTAGASGGGLGCPNGYGVVGTKLTVENCIIANNSAGSGSADSGMPDWFLGTYGKIEAASGNNLTGPNVTLIGENSRAGDPLFMDRGASDYRVSKMSLARNLASPAERSIDLTGCDRTDDLTAGCYNYVQETEFTVSILPYATAFFKGGELGLEAVIENPPTDVELEYEWKLLSNGGTELTWSGIAVTNTLDYGAYAITFNAIDKLTRTVLKSAVGEKMVYVTSRTNYVTSVQTVTPLGPYDTPDCAATNLLDVLNWLIDGSTVVLDAGVHLITGAVNVAVGATIVGQGRDRTTVRQTKPDRVIRLDSAAAKLCAMTVAGGTVPKGESSGAGVLITGKGGSVTDCTITGCGYGVATLPYGVGVCLNSEQAVVDRCIITCCTNSASGIPGVDVGGIGAAAAVLAGVLRNTLVTHNWADKDASVVGCWAGTVQNCTIVSNRVLGSGYRTMAFYRKQGRIENCLVTDNIAKGTPAEGAYCSCPDWGVEAGATLHAGVKNCYWGSKSDLGENAVPKGDVAFKDPSKDDWRICTRSVCRNAGLNDDSWMKTGKDLGGKKRINARIVDVGCYEADPMGLVIILK